MKTYKLFYALIIASFCISCGTSHKASLSMKYDAQKSFTTNKDYDYVWDNVIDFFAATGITVTNIEKASGFITASNITFDNNFTVEDVTDKKYNPKAYFVVPNNNFETAEITANFNVRVRKNNDNTVTVSINLPNLKGVVYKRDKLTGVVFPYVVETASTGVFEKNLFSALAQ